MTERLRAVLRTDGRAEVGLGHVRRCLALAEALRELDAECTFVVDGDRRLLALVAAAGFEAVEGRLDREPEATLAECQQRAASVVVVDSYALATPFLKSLGAAGRLVAAFDDLGDRDLPVAVVVNGSARAGHLPYGGASDTRWLLGPRHLVLCRELADLPRRDVADRVTRVLITVGGSDPFGLTPRISRWTAAALGPVAQDVVIGPLFPPRSRLECARSAGAAPVTLHEDPKDLSALMLAADLAVCGGGHTTYELAATGTPAVAIRVADNQTLNVTALDETGTLTWAGDVHDPDLERRVTTAVGRLAADPATRADMSVRGRALVDGRGAARVARVIVDVAERASR